MFRSPLVHLQRQWGPVTFSGDYLALVVLAGLALGGLGIFLRFTSMGIAIRGAAHAGV